MRYVSAAQVAIASLVLSACGGSEPVPGETESSNAATESAIMEAATPEPDLAEITAIDWRDPCRALSAEDLDAVFPGVQFEPRPMVQDTWDSLDAATGSCLYNARAVRAEDAYLVTLTIGVWKAEQSAYGRFAAVTSPDRDGVDVLDGFAEGGAYISDGINNVATFMDNGTVFQIQVKHDAHSSFDGRDQSVALARRLADRI